MLKDSSYHAGVLFGNALKKKKAYHLISLGMYTEPIGSGSADRKTPASQSGWAVCLLDQVTDIRGRQPADLCGHRKSGHCHAHQGRGAGHGAADLFTAGILNRKVHGRLHNIGRKVETAEASAYNLTSQLTRCRPDYARSVLAHPVA